MPVTPVKSTSPPASSLDLFTDDELIAELLHRCDHGIVGLYRNTGQGTILTTRRWKGVSHLVSGLATDIAGIVIASAYDAVSGRGHAASTDWPAFDATDAAPPADPSDPSAGDPPP